MDLRKPTMSGLLNCHHFYFYGIYSVYEWSFLAH